MGLVPKALLRLQRAVIVKAMPLRQHGASVVQCETIAAEIERRLPLLTDQHAGLLPGPAEDGTECARAPVHLERGCLALAAWQSIADSGCLELSTSAVLRAQCVAAGFGVRLDESGSISDIASAGFSERVIEAAGRFGSRFAPDQRRFAESMVANFQSDLGRGFEFESLSPSPNFRLTRCLYREIMVAGGAPDLTPIFWTEHRAALSSSSSFVFEWDTAKGECLFRFDSDGGSSLPPADRIKARLTAAGQQTRRV